VTGGIAGRLAEVRARIAAAAEHVGRDPAEITLVGVTKGQPAAAVDAAIAAGVRDIGENRVQEGTAKRAACAHATDATWHLIGHLQTNKARAALNAFAILQSVDSERLVRALGELAAGPVTVLIEVNVSGEPGKFGVAPDGLPSLLAAAREYPGLDVKGLMTVAPLHPDPDAARPYFRELASLAREHRLPWLSMGMTNDFETAIEEGATHVRIGRAIFGERPA